jgi:hypothetical protein
MSIILLCVRFYDNDIVYLLHLILNLIHLLYFPCCLILFVEQFVMARKASVLS